MALPLPGIVFPAEQRKTYLDHRHHHVLAVHIGHSHRIGHFIDHRVLKTDTDHRITHATVHLCLGTIGFSLRLEHGKHGITGEDAVEQELSVYPVEALCQRIGYTDRSIGRTVEQGVEPGLNGQPGRKQTGKVILQSGTLHLNAENIGHTTNSNVSH